MSVNTRKLRLECTCSNETCIVCDAANEIEWLWDVVRALRLAGGDMENFISHSNWCDLKIYGPNKTCSCPHNELRRKWDEACDMLGELF